MRSFSFSGPEWKHAPVWKKVVVNGFPCLSLVTLIVSAPYLWLNDVYFVGNGRYFAQLRPYGPHYPVSVTIYYAWSHLRGLTVAIFLSGIVVPMAIIRVRTINRIYRLRGEFDKMVPLYLQKESSDGYPCIVSTCRVWRR